MKSIYASLELKLVVILCVVCVSLLGCSTMQATAYTPASEKDHDGYSHVKLTDTQYRIVFNGNRETAMTSVKDYAMLHAAELTLDSGYDWFVIADSETDVETKKVAQVPSTTISQTQTSSTCGIVGCAIPSASRTTTSTHTNATYAKDVKDKVISSLLITMGKDLSSKPAESFDAKYLAANLRSAL